MVWSTATNIMASGATAFNSIMGNGYRPPQWSNELNEVHTYLVDSQGNSYFFDAIIHLDHETTTRITENPVQSGANISDHAYQMSARLTLEIEMSDVMDVYQSGQFSEYSTKSVSAYQKLLDLQKARLPMQIFTRLIQYQNMLIEHMAVYDDHKTLYGLKAMVNFRQIMTGTIATTAPVISAVPDVTNTTIKVNAIPDPDISPMVGILQKYFPSIAPKVN